jgi:hypothetical protein
VPSTGLFPATSSCPPLKVVPQTLPIQAGLLSAPMSDYFRSLVSIAPLFSLHSSVMMVTTPLSLCAGLGAPPQHGKLHRAKFVAPHSPEPPRITTAPLLCHPLGEQQPQPPSCSVRYPRMCLNLFSCART